jgi:hypothetical protein
MSDPAVERWLAAFVLQHGGVAGSAHHLQDGMLRLSGAFRLPEPVIRATAEIPRGKGMAGLAWERGQAVQTCNLREDTSGAVKPGAKAVAAKAAVALPIFGIEGFRAVVGIAWDDERVLDEETLAALTQTASLLPELQPETSTKS